MPCKNLFFNIGLFARSSVETVAFLTKTDQSESNGFLLQIFYKKSAVYINDRDNIFDVFSLASFWNPYKNFSKVFRRRRTLSHSFYGGNMNMGYYCFPSSVYFRSLCFYWISVLYHPGDFSFESCLSVLHRWKKEEKLIN